MSLKINERRRGGVVILDLTGRITIADGTVTLRKRVQKLLKEGQKALVLNLAGVNYIDSSGLGELVASYTTVRNARGDLRLLSLSGRVRDLMEVTKLLTVFDIFDEEDWAVRSFTSQQA